MRLATEQMQSLWKRSRGREVLPVCLIVAVAVICMVVAAVSSAQRADDVVREHERRLFVNAIAERRMQLVHEVENVATSVEALRRIWLKFDRDWVNLRIGLRLMAYFSHELVFVLDGADRLLYVSGEPGPVNGDRLDGILQELAPIVAAMRGRDIGGQVEVEPAGADPATGIRRPRRATRLQKLIHRPAIVAAVAVQPADSTTRLPEGSPPLIIAADLIDDGFLGRLEARLKLAGLREASPDSTSPRAQYLDLSNERGEPIARFVWTPQALGAEIASGIVPFIVIAVGSLLLFAAFAVRYMRRTAATISASENRLRHLALHDPLSGLPNRTLFGEHLEATIATVRRSGVPAAVLCIDLDHFKDVNDTLGHHVGDELIGAVTGRLCGVVRDQDLVARLGGDEFAIIVPGIAGSTALMNLAERIIASLSAPYMFMGQTIAISASVGIAVIDGRAESAADVMRHADMALYRAKNEGRRRASIYDEVMDAALLQRRALEQDLRDAMARHSLELVYQPILSASGERIVGVEALARWNHPVRGPIPPGEFIPVAEQSGLIIPLGEWALRQACLDAARWPVTVAVNISPLHFRRPDFTRLVARVLAETGFEPSRLELEVTESTLLGNVEGVEAAMRQLNALGVRLALDDFGTGYSSLMYLRRLPFDKLKIDSSFVTSIEDAAEAAPIVHAIVSLGRGLGMKVTAEGVETAEQHLFLRAAGVHFMQGFHFGAPVPAAQLESRIRAEAVSPESHVARLAKAG